MPATTEEQTVQTMEFRKEELINAPIDIVFEAVLAELGPEGQSPDGTPLALKLEPWPGGRWYRDLGDNKGHFWGHVQVIKPPALLELCGPTAMSYPATNHIQYRLVPEGGRTAGLPRQRRPLVPPRRHRVGARRRPVRGRLLQPDHRPL